MNAPDVILEPVRLSDTRVRVVLDAGAGGVVRWVGLNTDPDRCPSEICEGCPASGCRCAPCRCERCLARSASRGAPNINARRRQMVLL